MPNRRQALLRFYDTDDNLLRIMRTSYPDRDAKLRRRQIFGWPTAIHRHEIEWFATGEACKRAAVHAHLTEHPLHPDETLDLTSPSTPATTRHTRRKYALYRLFDAANNLLYIGRSEQPESAIAVHRMASSGWQTTIDRHTIEWFERQAESRDASRQAHLSEQPLHPDPQMDLSPPVVRPVYVYRLFDAKDELIYVGQSYRPEWRIQQHIDYRFDDVARWTIEQFPDRNAASREERRAIATENPRANIADGGYDAEERRPKRTPYNAAQDIKARFLAGEITVRTMFAELLMFPGVTPRKAAHLLGFADGSPIPRRARGVAREGTVDLMLQINNLGPDWTVRDMPATWREDAMALR